MRHMNEDSQRHFRFLSERLQELSAARHELIRQLNDLEAQARPIRWERNAMRNFFVPISSLPDEILEMIFDAGMRSTRQDYARHFGVLVSHVIGRWRHIALANPRLWATVQCIVPDGVDDEDYGQIARRLRDRATTFLSRTRVFPVDVQIDGFRDSSFRPEFIRLIEDHIGHCCHLQTKKVGNAGLQRLLKIISSKPTPFLRLINLASDDVMELSEPLFPHSASQLRAAMVHSLDLVTMPLCLPAFKSMISLQLTDLWIDIDDPGWVAFRDVLMALQSLDYLSLQLGCFSVTPHYLPVVLPTIRFLNVDASACPGALGLLLSCVQAASVTTLSLAAWGGVDVEDQLNLADELELHFPSLRHLILANVTVMDHVQVDMFAKRFPDIERLTCWSECLTVCDIDKIIIAIVRGAGNADNETDVNVSGGSRWPQLRTIALSTLELEEHYNASALQTVVQKLLDVIQCWKNAGHGIRELILPNSISRTGTEAMTELGKIVEIGQYHIDWPQFADPLYKRVVGEYW